MGACASGLLEKLGPQFAQLVACEKGKEFVDKKVEQIKKLVEDKQKEIQNDAEKLVDEKEKETLDKFKDAQDDIQKQKPGSLEKAASLQRKSVDELLGADEIKNKFNELREQQKEQFGLKNKEILDQVDQQSGNVKKQLDEQKPSIPIYDSLPQAQQKKVFKEGENKFKTQIKAKQGQIQKDIEEKLNIDQYTKMFENLNPSDKLDEISGTADSLIENGKKLLSGGSILPFC